MRIRPSPKSASAVHNQAATFLGPRISYPVNHAAVARLPLPRRIGQEETGPDWDRSPRCEMGGEASTVAARDELVHVLPAPAAPKRPGEDWEGEADGSAPGGRIEMI